MRMPSFLTKDFILLSASSFFFFSSFNMLIPELPGYLASMGGEKYIGLIIALFTLTAGLSRPFSGKLADTIGRIPVMLIGVAVCLAMCTLYPLVTTVFAFLLLRFFHGFSTGFTPTGTSAYIADIVPFNRRGEALGLHSLFASLGMAAGPALGGWIAAHFGLNTLFISAAAVSGLSAILLVRLTETLPNPQKMKLSFLKLKKDEIIERRVLNPSLVLMLAVFSFGTVLTIIPEFSAHLGMRNKGLFFAVFTLSSLAIRLLAGRVSDRYGRIPVLQVASATMVLAMFLVSIATAVPQLLLGAVFFGFAVGMSSPTVAAWTIDLSDENKRGRALATMYIALEAGIGLGALISGWLYQGNPERFPLVFMVSGSTALLAFIYLFTIPKHQRLKTLLRR
ncbi:MAG: MFS transporter [Flavobacteriales bacterium]|nr:MAG: MFS transporter [Flavobacteriales bacterium]